jgi:hypothetical protein
MLLAATRQLSSTPHADKVLTHCIYIYRLVSMKTPRLSPQTLRVLERFVERPTAWRYGYELSH